MSEARKAWVGFSVKYLREAAQVAVAGTGKSICCLEHAVEFLGEALLGSDAIAVMSLNPLIGVMVDVDNIHRAVDIIPSFVKHDRLREVIREGVIEDSDTLAEGYRFSWGEIREFVESQPKSLDGDPSWFYHRLVLGVAFSLARGVGGVEEPDSDDASAFMMVGGSLQPTGGAANFSIEKLPDPDSKEFDQVFDKLKEDVRRVMKGTGDQGTEILN